MNKAKLLALTSILFFSLIILDQFSKYLIRFQGGFYLCNTGIAWGIKLPSFLFWIFWILIVFFILYLIYRELFQKNSFNILFLSALILILGGTMGNLIDRTLFGCIIDFIDLRVWPVFNLADSFITIGALLIIFKSQFSIFKK
jgi:signal peptidase II